MVAEDVVIVLTDLAVNGYPEPNAQETVIAQTRNLKYNTEYYNVAELEDIYPRYLNNTVIRKMDGSYLVCGGAEGIYFIIYAHEFYLCKQIQYL